MEQRNPDLSDSAAAEVTAARREDTDSTHRLHTSLLSLEELGFISRLSCETNAEVIVTDRARLVELRRRPDERHFSLDDLRL